LGILEKSPGNGFQYKRKKKAMSRINEPALQPGVILTGQRSKQRCTEDFVRANSRKETRTRKGEEGKTRVNNGAGCKLYGPGTTSTVRGEAHDRHNQDLGKLPIKKNGDWKKKVPTKGDVDAGLEQKGLKNSKKGRTFGKGTKGQHSGQGLEKLR